MTYHAKVIAGGKIVIPAELRRELGIKDGDSLVLESGQGGVTIRTFSQIVREEQQKFRAMVGPEYTVDEFIAQRREDWPDE
jgi:AbrB family looped-hinge helix DNA binding protein